MMSDTRPRPGPSYLMIQNRSEYRSNSEAIFLCIPTALRRVFTHVHQEARGDRLRVPLEAPQLFTSRTAFSSHAATERKPALWHEAHAHCSTCALCSSAVYA